MDVIAYAVGIVTFVILIGFVVAAVLSSSEKAGRKRKEDLQTRHLARQPWDAHSASGRGIR